MLDAVRRRGCRYTNGRIFGIISTATALQSIESGTPFSPMGYVLTFQSLVKARNSWEFHPPLDPVAQLAGILLHPHAGPWWALAAGEPGPFWRLTSNVHSVT